MSNFMNCSTWIWDFDDSIITVKVSKLTVSYYIKFEIGHNSMDISISKDNLRKLGKQIEEILGKENSNG